jgi:hypothetical protein
MHRSFRRPDGVRRIVSWVVRTTARGISDERLNSSLLGWRPLREAPIVSPDCAPIYTSCLHRWFARCPRSQQSKPGNNTGRYAPMLVAMLIFPLNSYVLRLKAALANAKLA